MSKKKKYTNKRPRGFWTKKKNRKAFLDGLLKKYKITPGEITYRLVNENSGGRIFAYYDSLLAMLETHYGKGKIKGLRKPKGYWISMENQKDFLDGLLKKYKCKPEKITTAILEENGGSSLYRYYNSTLELLETHYGEMQLIDMLKVPQGAWDDPELRIRAVRQAVARLGKRPDRVLYDDLIRVGLAGLLTEYTKGFRTLMQEAGYDVPDLVSWKTKKARVKKIKELVKEAGGVERFTLTYVKKKARGLIEYYVDRMYWNPDREEVNIPLIYYMLEEAGYDVTVEECIRGVYSPNDMVLSLHGDWNHSIAEAVIDDWVYEIVGMDHDHDKVYPGQEDTREDLRADCDFLLFPPEVESPKSKVKSKQHAQARTRHLSPVTCPSTLWVEYAGLWAEGKGREFEKYRARMEWKKVLAEEAEVKLVVIKPEKLEKQPEKLWAQIEKKAPWLKDKRDVALQSKFLKRFSI